MVSPARPNEVPPRAGQLLERYDQTEPLVHAFTWFDRDAVAAVDDPQAAGPLAGRPFAVKDVFAVAGTETRCGSATLAGNHTETDAEIVARLRSAGAVLVGKLVTHELTCGLDDPGTRNPWHLDRYPGGSSAGAGAAVATGVCDFAIGTDAAGSIRIPAAATATVGLKPTYGLLPTGGLQRYATAPSIDHVGVIARDVQMVEDVLSTLTATNPAELPEGSAPLAGVRLGLPAWKSAEVAIDPKVADRHAEALDLLHELGAELVPLEMPEFEVVPDIVFTLFPAELAAAHRDLLRDNGDEYHPDVRQLLEMGAQIGPEQIEAAHRTQASLRELVTTAFARHRLHAMVTPTLPAVPPLLADLVPSRDLRTLTTLTAPYNVTGQPALSVPSGFVDGLPVGLQIAGRRFDEAGILRIGRAYLDAARLQPTTPPI